MGLDMYLRAGKYVSGYKFSDSTDVSQYAAILATLGLPDGLSPHSPSLTVKVTVAYWRKANAIHKWFVDNCQDGKDECQESYVSRDKLTELRDLCRRVLADPSTATAAAQLLPPHAGFFFGSTEVDEYYREDLQQTVDQLTRILNDERLKDFDFEYRSSW